MEEAHRLVDSLANPAFAKARGRGKGDQPAGALQSSMGLR